MKRSSTNYVIGEERIHELRESRDYKKRTRGKTLESLLLDSSLISPTNQKNYNVKILKCGNYIQVYEYNYHLSRKDKNFEKKRDIKILDIDNLFLSEEGIKETNPKYIEKKNVDRSKFSLQRLVKSNINLFKTFITLTFEENICDIETANKKFDIWRTKIKSIKKDFAYICVPEFQKRGAVHYHLLTNLDISQNLNLIIPQEKFTYKQLKQMSVKERSKCYDVKYWSYGFTSVFECKDINVVGYMSKYMTKDIDNRLYGKRRYLYSQNLNKPEEYVLDIENDGNDFMKMLYLIQDGNECYTHEYYDYFGNKVQFKEYITTSYNI